MESKKLRRRLRELAGLAYERELSRELELLLRHFEAWKRGEKNPFDLSDEIHRFHQGPARDLYKWYSDRNTELIVAKAIVEGALSEEEVGEEILSLVGEMVSFLRRERDVGE
jgi:hypothetical protein